MAQACPTPRLTRTLQLAVERQQPPRSGLVRPKLRYAHQGGVNPPLVIIHGSALHHVPDGYRRYLEHFLSDAFQLRGTPLRIQFKVGANPYADAPRTTPLAPWGVRLPAEVASSRKSPRPGCPMLAGNNKSGARP